MTSRERLEAMRRPFAIQRRTVQYDAEQNIKGQSIAWGPEREPYAPLSGAALARRSTLVDAEGKVIQSWQIEKPEDRQREALWREIADELSKQIFRVDPVTLPEEKFQDQLAFYPIGDHHTGAYAWKEETGDDNYDLKIAEHYLAKAGRALIELLPPCETALIASLGDFQHYDSMIPETPANRNKLDSDTRAQHMIRVVIRSMVRLITEALSRHKQVNVIIESGNHDPYSAAFLRESLAFFFEKEPRVKMDMSPAAFHYFRFGDVLIGTNHGDRVKAEDLPLIMAADRAEDWGATKFRYWAVGHVHHSQKRLAIANKDFKNVSVESFRVLAPLDAWSANEGYRSMRDMKALLIHKKYGEIGRRTVNPIMFVDTDQ